jgi:Cu+-exporting ATPase
MADLEGEQRRFLRRAAFSVDGMHCTACSGSVAAALQRVPGVMAAEAAALNHSAAATFDSRQTTTAVLLSALADAGFPSHVNSETLLQPDTETVRFRIAGMTCSSCSSAVESALAATPGVRHASVSLTLQEAKVEYDPELANEVELLQAIEDSGFEGRSLGRGDTGVLALEISGMTCSTCSTAVESALTAVDGVIEASVNAITGRADVKYDPDRVGPRVLLGTVINAGYEARLAPADPRADGALLREKEKKFWRTKFLLSLVFSIPLFIINMILMYIPTVDHALETSSSGFTVASIVSFSLATPVQFWVGWTFHKGAWRALRRGRPNMDVLVSLGTNCAYLYSLLSIAWERTHAEYDGHGNFFETSALLITFICLGKYLEAAAKGKTSQAIRELLRLAPATSTLLVVNPTDGSVIREEEVPTELLQRGDIVKVTPGSRVPVDGEIDDGRSHVDESMITGEPVPGSKGPGDAVVGGTVNCGGGVLRVRALRVGKDTTLSQIIKLVEDAQMSKAPIQALADRLSAVFVPIIVAAALLTWTGWYVAGVTGAFPDDWIPTGSNPFLFSMLFAIAVVVIACPCALGLATPTAVMVGTGVAATNGILIKSAEAIEIAHRLKHIVFDKTGTLTAGQPSVVDHRLLTSSFIDANTSAGGVNSGITLETALLAVASAETGSEHPLGRALMRYASSTLGHSGRRDSSNTSIGGGGGGDDFRDIDMSTSSSSETGHVELVSINGMNGGRGGQQQQQNGGGQGGPVTFPPASGYMRQYSIEDVAWLAPVRDMEVIPGNGVRCWVRLPKVKVASLFSQKERMAATTTPGSRVSSRNNLVENDSQHFGVNTTNPTGAAAALHSTDVEVRVAVGNRSLMAVEGATIDSETAAFLREWEVKGMTCVILALEGHPVAVFAIADQVKPEAEGVVKALRARGLQVHMITGDNWATARTIAAQLGIQHVMAEVLPAGKSARVAELQADGAAVGMVGDGINDSPALAAADVGIAVGRGTDIAIEAASVVLMKSDLEDVLMCLDLCSRTFRRIQYNYIWAFGYNIFAIPIAAGVLYPPLHFQLPPWIAGACMAMSSVSVVVSSLLLRRYKPPKKGKYRAELSA